MEASTKFLNAKVNHLAFGMGIITDIEGEIITIDFNDKGIKRFVYPDSFAQYLKLDDSILTEIVSTDLKNKTEAEETERAKLKEKYEAELQERKTKKQTKSKKKTK